MLSARIARAIRRRYRSNNGLLLTLIPAVAKWLRCNAHSYRRTDVRTALLDVGYLEYAKEVPQGVIRECVGLQVAEAFAERHLDRTDGVAVLG